MSITDEVAVKPEKGLILYVCCNRAHRVADGARGGKKSHLDSGGAKEYEFSVLHGNDYAEHPSTPR